MIVQINNFIQENQWVFYVSIIILYFYFKKKLKTEPVNDALISCILCNNTDGVIRSLELGQGGPYSKAKSGESALELAIMKDNKYIVAYLIKYGVIPNPKEIEIAFKYQNREIIEMVRTGNHLKLIKEYKLSN